MLATCWLLLPKFHCERNLIISSSSGPWGTVKKYLREHCDMMFDTLKANVPMVMESSIQSTVSLSQQFGNEIIAYTVGWRGGK